MKKIGIFYGSTTGTTESVAEQIASHLGVGSSEVYNVGNTDAKVAEEYELLILGSSTWGSGELQDDWYDFLEQLAGKNLSGKKIALFGCGDAMSFGSTFCDAVGIIYEKLQGTGATFIGTVDPSDYTYDASTAEIDGQLDSCILSGDMKIFVHHIYELQKGIRYMALCTIDKTDESFAIQRLEKSGLEYEICPINAHRLNLFFGKKECIDIVRLICNRPLNLLTPEEDFILGTMLGYDVCQQCERYNHRKTLIQSA